MGFPNVPERRFDAPPEKKLSRRELFYDVLNAGAAASIFALLKGEQEPDRTQVIEHVGTATEYPNIIQTRHDPMVMNVRYYDGITDEELTARKIKILKDYDLLGISVEERGGLHIDYKYNGSVPQDKVTVSFRRSGEHIEITFVRELHYFIKLAVPQPNEPLTSTWTETLKIDPKGQWSDYTYNDGETGLEKVQKWIKQKLKRR